MKAMTTTSSRNIPNPSPKIHVNTDNKIPKASANNISNHGRSVYSFTTIAHQIPNTIAESKKMWTENVRATKPG